MMIEVPKLFLHHQPSNKKMFQDFPVGIITPASPLIDIEARSALPLQWNSYSMLYQVVLFLWDGFDFEKSKNCRLTAVFAPTKKTLMSHLQDVMSEENPWQGQRNSAIFIHEI